MKNFWRSVLCLFQSFICEDNAISKRFSKDFNQIHSIFLDLYLYVFCIKQNEYQPWKDGNATVVRLSQRSQGRGARGYRDFDRVDYGPGCLETEPPASRQLRHPPQERARNNNQPKLTGLTVSVN